MTPTGSLSVSRTERFRPHITPVADRLPDKVAVVTGSGGGIGKAIALRFAQEGAQIAVTDQDFPLAEKLADEIRALGATAIALRLDVTQREEARAAVQAAARELGPI